MTLTTTEEEIRRMRGSILVAYSKEALIVIKDFLKRIDRSKNAGVPPQNIENLK